MLPQTATAAPTDAPPPRRRGAQGGALRVAPGAYDDRGLHGVQRLPAAALAPGPARTIRGAGSGRRCRVGGTARSTVLGPDRRAPGERTLKRLIAGRYCCAAVAPPLRCPPSRRKAERGQPLMSKASGVYPPDGRNATRTCWGKPDCDAAQACTLIDALLVGGVDLAAAGFLSLHKFFSHKTVRRTVYDTLFRCTDGWSFLSCTSIRPHFDPRGMANPPQSDR